jgi:hypothetical protein
MNERIQTLWNRYDKHKSSSLLNQIDLLEQQIELLNWVLGSEEK